MFVVCLTSLQHACVSQGRICSDNCTFCNNWVRRCRPNLHLTQSQYTDTRPTSPSTDPLKHQASHRVANGVPVFKSVVWLNPGISWCKWDSNPGSSALKADALTTRQTRRCVSPGLLYIDNQTHCHKVKSQIRPVSPSHSILWSGQPVLWLTLLCQASDRTAIRKPVFHITFSTDTLWRFAVLYASMIILWSQS